MSTPVVSTPAISAIPYKMHLFIPTWWQLITDAQVRYSLPRHVRILSA